MKKILGFVLLFSLLTVFATSAFANESPESFMYNAKTNHAVEYQDDNYIYYIEYNDYKETYTDVSTKIVRFSLADGSTEIIDVIADESPSYCNSVQFYNGYLFYFKDYSLIKHKIGSSEKINLGAIHAGAFTFGENNVYYVIRTSNEPSPLGTLKLASRDISTDKETVISDFAVYPKLLGVVGGDLYYSGTNYETKARGLSKINLTTKKHTMVSKDSEVDSFFFDSASNVIYFSDQNGIKKFNPLYGQIYLVRNMNRASFYNGGVNDYAYYILDIEKPSTSEKPDYGYDTSIEHVYFVADKLFLFVDQSNIGGKSYDSSERFKTIIRSSTNGMTSTDIQTQDVKLLSYSGKKLYYFLGDRLFSYSFGNSAHILVR